MARSSPKVAKKKPALRKRAIPAPPTPPPNDKPKRGRPTFCTPELTKNISDLLDEGVAFKTACESEGIGESTGHAWMLRGEESAALIGAVEAGEKVDPKGPKPEDEALFVAFSRAVTRARARGEIALHRLAKTGEKGSQQATWLLERRFRENYGPVNKIEHSGPGGKPIESNQNVKVDYSQLSDDELRRLAASGEAG